MVVKKGDKVKVEYEGKLDDGTVFDSSEKQGKPLEFEVGAGQMIKGFDAAVDGMDLNEEKEIVLKPEQAYGERNEEAIQKIPRDKLPAEAKVGGMLVAKLPNGGQMAATIKEMDDKEATVDMNHPMAGKTLHFKVKVVGIN